jgi:hypothetical protein
MTRTTLGRPTNRVSTGRLVVCIAAVSLGSLGLTGCGEEDLHAYQAPKSAPYAEPELFSRMGPGASANPAAPEPVGITWDVPDGWTEAPSTSSFITAVFEAKNEAGDARITVSSLTNDGGGVLQNINRWRGQVGLGPIQQFEEQPMTPITVAGQVAGVIDLSAPEGAGASLERLMVVFIPRPDQGLTWYFKMSGPSATLDEQKQAFTEFVESVGFGGKSGETSEADADGVVPRE